MKRKLFRIGLTGPSGAGKSAVAHRFLAIGVPVLDADAIYHDLLCEDGACVREIRSAFGDGIFSGRELNRKALARIVFAPDGEEKRLLLNAIAHKHVVLRIEQMIEELSRMGSAYCVIDAPLLIEAGMHEDCDLTLAVLADRDTRKSRIIARDGITEDEAEMRLSNQKDDDFYISHADRVLYNNGDAASLTKECMRITEAIGLKGGEAE